MTLFKGWEIDRDERPRTELRSSEVKCGGEVNLRCLDASTGLGSTREAQPVRCQGADSDNARLIQGALILKAPVSDRGRVGLLALFIFGASPPAVGARSMYFQTQS